MSKALWLLCAREEPGIFACTELCANNIALKGVLKPSDRCDHFKLQRRLERARIVVSVELSFEKVFLISQINYWNPVLWVRSISVSKLANLFDFLYHLGKDLEGTWFSTFAVGFEVCNCRERYGARHRYEFVEVQTLGLKVVQFSAVETRPAQVTSLEEKAIRGDLISAILVNALTDQKGLKAMVSGITRAGKAVDLGVFIGLIFAYVVSSDDKIDSKSLAVGEKWLCWLWLTKLGVKC